MMYWSMLIPALVCVLGGLMAMIWSPSHHARSLIQHFAAGVVLAALAVEVLPELEREHVSRYLLIGAFAAGGMMMYLIKIWTIRLEEKAAEKISHSTSTAAQLNYGLLVATFVDIAVDGLLIGAGFAASSSTGFVLALGLSVELLFLGLALVSDVIKGWRILAMTALLAVTVLSFSYMGFMLLQHASKEVISVILAMGVAVLLYLVTDELLIEAHEVEEKPSSSLWLFAGFLVFWAIQLFAV